MFVAIDNAGRKVNPLDNDLDELRLMSNSKQLLCPECLTGVRFAAGPQVTAHFKHIHLLDCTYDSEPETAEHLKGKMLIRNWLLEQFPEAQVEFEYKIKETNQRADVMAILPDGKRLAFEMQCSKIPGSVWKERHALYKSAGIQDFWILGESVHRYGKSEGIRDTSKHQLVSLASAIYKEKNALFFLDTDSKNFRALYQHKMSYWHSDTIIVVHEEGFSLNEARVYKQFIGTDRIRNEFKSWYTRKLEVEHEEKIEEEREKREREIRKKKRIEAIKLREKLTTEYIRSLSYDSLESVTKMMTSTEKEYFERLLKKHGFSDDNFPGVFNVFTDYNYLFRTPSHLWQLWIYDKYIYRKSPTFQKIWVPKIKDEMYRLREVGVFHFNYTYGDDHFSFAIYDYLRKLSSLGIVEKLGFMTTKYQQVIVNKLPPLTGRDVHRDVAFHLSFENDALLIQSARKKEIEESFLFYRELVEKSY